MSVHFFLIEETGTVNWGEPESGINLCSMPSLQSSSVNHLSRHYLCAMCHSLDLAFAKVILESLGSEGLLLFDGWDEHSHRTTFLADLVENPLKFGLNLCTIVVTTRPVAADKLRRLATSRIDIMAFCVEERLEYFKATLEDYEEELEELLEHLDKHPLIAGSAYIPVVAAFLVDIVLALGMSLPITLHGMFVDIILCNILRETTKSSPELDICIRNINTLDGLIEKYPSINKNILQILLSEIAVAISM